MNSSTPSTTGNVPRFKGGYFPPLILELLSNIVSSLTDSFSSGAVVCRFRRSALVISVSQAVRQRMRWGAGDLTLEAILR